MIGYRRVCIAVLIAIMAFLLISIAVIQSDVALGGMVSEKLLGRAGVTDSSLLLGRAGTDTELSVLGFAPIVSTQAVGSTSVPGGVSTAVLRGRVTNMNGMPIATGYFQWGYAAGTLTNTSATFVVTGVGDYSQSITGYNENDTVYYRFVTDCDGTAYGAVTSFLASHGTGGFLIKALLRILLACSILLTVLLIGSKGGFVAMLIFAVIGVIAFGIIDAVIIRLL